MPDTATYIRELYDFSGDACLVEYEGEYYAVSTIATAFDTGRGETLVFPANAEGEITEWQEVCGGSGYTREDAIEALVNTIDSGREHIRNDHTEYMDEVGGPIGMMAKISGELGERLSGPQPPLSVDDLTTTGIEEENA